MREEMEVKMEVVRGGWRMRERVVEGREEEEKRVHMWCEKVKDKH